MSYTLIFTEQYNRRALRFIKRHPDLKKSYLKTLQLLEINPFHPSLRLHALQGKLQPLYSISINLSYRITLELLISLQIAGVGQVDLSQKQPEDLGWFSRQYPGFCWQSLQLDNRML